MNSEVAKALEQLIIERGIARDVLIQAIEQALVSAYRRNYGSAQNVRVHLDRDTWEPKVYAQKTVVAAVTDPRLEISLDEVRASNPALEAGDVFEVPVNHREFGRIAAQTAKQVVVQRIREAERGIVYEEFAGREGDIMHGIVIRQERNHRTVFVDVGQDTEGTLAPQEQIAGERLLEGQHIWAYVIEVKKAPRGTYIALSRTHPGLLRRLFEREVPEIHDGTVDIKAIAREAGSRSKIAVHSRDENVDPVGACVGAKGLRVQNIVNELQGEKIDIVKWDADPEVFIAHALSPAKVVSVTIDESVGRLGRVIVPDSHLSLAIGKEGQNARLAAKLTGWKIDIKSESQAEGNVWETAAGSEDHDFKEIADI